MIRTMNPSASSMVKFGMTSVTRQTRRSLSQVTESRLSNAVLDALPAVVNPPNYHRDQLSSSIVHLGVGNFHRAHLAWYNDQLLRSFSGRRESLKWGITGVHLMEGDRRAKERLSEQDSLYSLTTRKDQPEVRVIGSHVEQMFAPADPESVLEKLSSPSTDIVSLTITEKGYCLNNEATLDFDQAAVAHDVENPQQPKTAMGYILEALRRRRERGVSPFTVMSCDNLPNNGKVVAGVLQQLAYEQERSDELPEWMQLHVTCPSSMVDRITPATTEHHLVWLREEHKLVDLCAVTCEEYADWYIENKFVNPSNRPPWEEVGANVVDDVIPFELMKLRMLNGSHWALSYISYLLGHRIVSEAMADQRVLLFVRLFLGTVQTTVPLDQEDLSKYAEVLVDRFANPHIEDHVQRLAEDGSTKLPGFITESLEHRLEQRQSFEAISFAVAAWIHYLTGVDHQNEKIEIKDPKLDTLQPLAIAAVARSSQEGSDHSGVKSFIVAAFNSNLAESPFTSSVHSHVHNLAKKGPIALNMCLLNK